MNSQRSMNAAAVQANKGPHAHAGPLRVTLWTVCAQIVPRHGSNDSLVGSGHLRHDDELFCVCVCVCVLLMRWNSVMGVLLLVAS